MLIGALAGLVCVAIGVYLLFKKYTGQTEINIRPFGTLKTTHNGIVLLFIAVFLFVFSSVGYAQTRKLSTTTLQLNESKILNASLSQQLFKVGNSIILVGQLVQTVIPDSKTKRLVVRLDSPMKIANQEVSAVDVAFVLEDIKKYVGKHVELTSVPITLKSVHRGDYVAVSAASIREQKSQ